MKYVSKKQIPDYRKMSRREKTVIYKSAISAVKFRYYTCFFPVVFITGFSSALLANLLPFEDPFWIQQGLFVLFLLSTNVLLEGFLVNPQIQKILKAEQVK